jgi:predicted enzyme related to lactoylglutathione lyase
LTGIQAEGDTAMAKHGEWNHIEIPADDLSRARGFYENVLGWNFSEVPGFEDYHLYSGDQAGIGGAIGRRDVTAPHHVRNYVNVDDIDATLPRVTAHGGRIVEPKSEVMGQGSYAVVEDSEGNEFALWQQDHTEA